MTVKINFILNLQADTINIISTDDYFTINPLILINTPGTIQNSKMFEDSDRKKRKAANIKHINQLSN